MIKLFKHITTASYVTAVVFLFLIIMPLNMDVWHSFLLAAAAGLSCARPEPKAAVIPFVVLEALTLAAAVLALSQYGVVFAVFEFAVMRAHAYYNLIGGSTLSILLLITGILLGFVLFSHNLDLATSVGVAFALFVGGVLRIDLN